MRRANGEVAANQPAQQPEGLLPVNQPVQKAKRLRGLRLPMNQPAQQAKKPSSRRLTQEASALLLSQLARPVEAINGRENVHQEGGIADAQQIPNQAGIKEAHTNHQKGVASAAATRSHRLPTSKRLTPEALLNREALKMRSHPLRKGAADHINRSLRLRPLSNRTKLRKRKLPEDSCQGRGASSEKMLQVLLEEGRSRAPSSGVNNRIH